MKKERNNIDENLYAEVKISINDLIQIRSEKNISEESRNIKLLALIMKKLNEIYNKGNCL